MQAKVRLHREEESTLSCLLLLLMRRLFRKGFSVILFSFIKDLCNWDLKEGMEGSNWNALANVREVGP